MSVPMREYTSFARAVSSLFIIMYPNTNSLTLKHRVENDFLHVSPLLKCGYYAENK